MYQHADKESVEVQVEFHKKKQYAEKTASRLNNLPASLYVSNA